MTIEINIDRMIKTHPYDLKPYDVVTMGTMNAKNTYIFKYHSVSDLCGDNRERIYGQLTDSVIKKIRNDRAYRYGRREFWTVSQVFKNIETGEDKQRSTQAIVFKLTNEVKSKTIKTNRYGERKRIRQTNW